jgi:selenophosphate synthetase-related protein
MNIPILGGNTNLEGEAEANIFVVGELLRDEPIRQSGGKKGDKLLLLGEPIWGEQEERFEKAKRLFSDWYSMLGKADIHAAKDVTKGGLKLTAKEIADSSGCELELKSGLDIHMTRNLDNFLLAVDAKNADKISTIGPACYTCKVSAPKVQIAYASPKSAEPGGIQVRHRRTSCVEVGRLL